MILKEFRDFWLLRIIRKKFIFFIFVRNFAIKLWFLPLKRVLHTEFLFLENLISKDFQKLTKKFLFICNFYVLQ